LRQQAKRREAPAGDGTKTPLDERIADEARFFKAWFENPAVTGAVSPSGRFLARAMAKFVDPDSHGPIVELGPGTGPVTQALLQRGVTPERLILVEYDTKFCRLLERRFPRCNVVQGDAYNLKRTLKGELDGKAAAVVSSLPLLNKPDPERLSLLREAFELMRPDGCFVQFTYGMISPIPRRSKHGVGLAFHAEASPPVWLNLPPARVWVYRPAHGLMAPPKRPGEALIVKLKERRDKVREEIRETAERVETKIKAQTARARREFEARARKVREDKKIKPALELLKKISEPKSRRRP
jgi:phosphatidylethanolamine/phosphatidyl-N-methylethanolamine N-methyltransferase